MDRDTRLIRDFIDDWTRKPGNTQVLLAEKSGLGRTWLNAFLGKGYNSIPIGRVRRLARGVGMELRPFLEATGVIQPLQSDLGRVLQDAGIPKNERVLRILDLEALLERRPLLAQLLVILQSAPDPDVAFVVKAARGIVQAGTIPKLSPTDWPNVGIDECQRCGAVVMWNPVTEKEFDGLCDDCKREADPSKRISPRRRVTPEMAAASVKPLTPSAKRPREKKKK
jgi:hypothetical protein